MRVQSDSKVRSCPLSPPGIILKQKKPSTHSYPIPRTEPAAPSSVVLTPEECLSHLDIRVGRIVKAWNHPDSEKWEMESLFVVD